MISDNGISMVKYTSNNFCFSEAPKYFHQVISAYFLLILFINGAFQRYIHIMVVHKMIKGVFTLGYDGTIIQELYEIIVKKILR